MIRDSFIFPRCIYEAIRDLPRDMRDEIYAAIMEYGLYGREPDLQPTLRSIFALMRTQIDAGQLNTSIAPRHTEKLFDRADSLAAEMKSPTAWREQAAMANRLSLGEIDTCIDAVCAYMVTAGHPLTIREARTRLPRQVQIFKSVPPKTRQEADDSIKQSALNRLNDAINRFDNEAGTFSTPPGL